MSIGGPKMATVKVSSKFQVVIPESVRNSLDIKPGMHIDVIVKGKIAYLVPVANLKGLQIELSGKIDQKKLREKKDRAS
jgi:AbrB family looped-hinge helix DNA binding protein